MTDRSAAADVGDHPHLRRRGDREVELARDDPEDVALLTERRRTVGRPRSRTFTKLHRAVHR